MERLDMPDSIRTVSGIYVNIFEPTPEMIDIKDIAHSLAHQCRFGGHLPEFYSVAQHSILCSKMVDAENCLAALMHDASEAYLLDIPSPIKKRLTNYKELEDNLMTIIAKKYNFQWPLSNQVKEADYAMLVSEWHGLMLKQPSRNPIIPLNFEKSKELFLSSFELYSNL